MSEKLSGGVAQETHMTLWGQIAEVYGNLDAEDCNFVDREWARMRGYILPTDGTSTLVRSGQKGADDDADLLTELAGAFAESDSSAMVLGWKVRDNREAILRAASRLRSPGETTTKTERT